MKLATILVTLSLLLLTAPSLFAAAPPEGYAGMKWGTPIEVVTKQYKGGQVGKLHSDVLYKQSNPNGEMVHRTFIFKENKLIAVSVKFNADYVKKLGIDSLLAQHKKAYGEGTIDRSQGPHMVTYIWEGKHTRITYAYAPKRADMCVVLYQQK